MTVIINLVNKNLPLLKWYPTRRSDFATAQALAQPQQ